MPRPPQFFIYKTMGLKNFIAGMFAGPDKGMGVDELARRMKMSVDELRLVHVGYRQFTLPKKSGGQRIITAPDDKLKVLQRHILHRILGGLKSHPLATGFERGHSIVTNASCHVGRKVVIKLDMKDFFQSTAADRVKKYFQQIGWNRDAVDLLSHWCTYKGGLPQGAPTSPRLSNLVNHRMDARLYHLTDKKGGAYTRYADDMTFSFMTDDPDPVNSLIGMVRKIVKEEGYDIHEHKKLQVRRRHDCQKVTGLVVNERVNLPRKTRRWLRSVEHRVVTGKVATLSPAQLEGWISFQSMVRTQAESAAKLRRPDGSSRK